MKSQGDDTELAEMDRGANARSCWPGDGDVWGGSGVSSRYLDRTTNWKSKETTKLINFVLDNWELFKLYSQLVQASK